MTALDTYAASRPIPYLLEIGKTQTLECPIRYGQSGSLVEPASGTITIEDPNGEELVSGAAVVIASSTATYSFAMGASETSGEGYTVYWNLVFGGVTKSFRYDAYACDYVPYNTVSANDLYPREPELEFRIPQKQLSDAVGWQPQIDEAYYDFIQWLLDSGRPVWLIRGMTGMKAYLRNAALALCCNALSTSNDSEWRTKADFYRDSAELSLARMKIQYSDEDAGIKRGASPIIRLAPVGRPIW